MPTDESADMARRALLTEAEREHIRGEKENQQRTWEAISRIRSRIQNQMKEDVEILQEHRPDLLEELRDVVCRYSQSQEELDENDIKRIVLHELRELESETDTKSVRRQTLEDNLINRNYDEEDIEKAIDALFKQGMMYVPKDGHLKLTD